MDLSLDGDVVPKPVGVEKVRTHSGAPLISPKSVKLKCILVRLECHFSLSLNSGARLYTCICYRHSRELRQ